MTSLIAEPAYSCDVGDGVSSAVLSRMQVLGRAAKAGNNQEIEGELSRKFFWLDPTHEDIAIKAPPCLAFGCRLSTAGYSILGHG